VKGGHLCRVSNESDSKLFFIDSVKRCFPLSVASLIERYGSIKLNVEDPFGPKTACVKSFYSNMDASSTKNR